MGYARATETSLNYAPATCHWEESLLWRLRFFLRFAQSVSTRQEMAPSLLLMTSPGE
jgi:hypothetical protein